MYSDVIYVEVFVFLSIMSSVLTGCHWLLGVGGGRERSWATTPQGQGALMAKPAQS